MLVARNLERHHDSLSNLELCNTRPTCLDLGDALVAECKRTGKRALPKVATNSGVDEAEPKAPLELCRDPLEEQERVQIATRDSDRFHESVSLIDQLRLRDTFPDQTSPTRAGDLPHSRDPCNSADRLPGVTFESGRERSPAFPRRVRTPARAARRVAELRRPTPPPPCPPSSSASLAAAFGPSQAVPILTAAATSPTPAVTGTAISPLSSTPNAAADPVATRAPKVPPHIRIYPFPLFAGLAATPVQGAPSARPPHPAIPPPDETSGTNPCEDMPEGTPPNAALRAPAQVNGIPADNPVGSRE